MSMPEIRRELMSAAKESDLVKIYGLSDLTAAAILAVSYSEWCADCAEDARYQDWLYPDSDCDHFAEYCAFCEKADLYAEFAKANGAGYMFAA